LRCERGRPKKVARERVSPIEQTRHTIDPLFKPFKARLSRYRVSVFPCLLYPSLSLSISLSFSLSLHLSIKIERWGREREREREIEEREDGGKAISMIGDNRDCFKNSGS
jgi:hypothetical protein